MTKYEKEYYGVDGSIQDLTREAVRLFPSWAALFDTEPRRVNCFSDDEEEYSLELELAGFDKKDITMEVQPSKHLSGKYLIIKGFKEVRGSEKNVSERFLMPENSDPSKISAELKNGLLSVKVEKLEDSKPLQVKIN